MRYVAYFLVYLAMELLLAMLTGRVLRFQRKGIEALTDADSVSSGSADPLSKPAA